MKFTKTLFYIFDLKILYTGIYYKSIGNGHSMIGLLRRRLQTAHTLLRQKVFNNRNG